MRRVARSSGVLRQTGLLLQQKSAFDAQKERERRMAGRVVLYPHRLLTRPVKLVGEKELSAPLFHTRVLDLCMLAKDLGCYSFSAPKAHWDAAVLLVTNNPDDEFDVWVNPEVAGYGDRNSLAPMYGMWENCISCDACVAWVVRPQRITCTGLDRYGNRRTEVLGGLRARCLMHELDHLNGRSIFQEAVGSDFVIGHGSLLQRDLWPANFPSAEAAMTGMHQLYDYVANKVITLAGMEPYVSVYNTSQEFQSSRLGS